MSTAGCAPYVCWQWFPRDRALNEGLVTQPGKRKVGRGDAKRLMPILAFFCRSGHAFNSIFPGPIPRLREMVNVL